MTAILCIGEQQVLVCGGSDIEMTNQLKVVSTKNTEGVWPGEGGNYI